MPQPLHPQEKGTQYPRIGLDAVKKRKKKISGPYQELNLVIQPIAC
jgi:hypothetical protein